MNVDDLKIQKHRITGYKLENLAFVHAINQNQMNTDLYNKVNHNNKNLGIFNSIQICRNNQKDIK